MKILFAGSSSIAVPSFISLSEMECRGEDIQLMGVLTNPDTPRGRKEIKVPTDISSAAAAIAGVRAEKGLPSVAEFKFDKLNAQAREQIAVLGCDLLVCFAYGSIFGPKFLSLFSRGGINIHPSLLPRFRGPSPIPAAILNRDKETGITIQGIAGEMDCGDIFVQEKIPLYGSETAFSLGETVAAKAALMLPQFLRRFLDGTARAVPQTGEPVYCSLIRREMARIDWELPAAEIDAMVRAYNPWPLCHTRWEEEDLYILEGHVLENEAKIPADTGMSGCIPVITGFYYSGYKPHLTGTVLGIDRDHGILVQTGDGVYAVSRLQRQAKKAMDWKSFLNGVRDFSGSLLE